MQFLGPPGPCFAHAFFTLSGRNLQPNMSKSSLPGPPPRQPPAQTRPAAPLRPLPLFSFRCPDLSFHYGFVYVINRPLNRFAEIHSDILHTWIPKMSPRIITDSCDRRRCCHQDSLVFTSLSTLAVCRRRPHMVIDESTSISSLDQITYIVFVTGNDMTHHSTQITASLNSDKYIDADIIRWDTD